MGDPSSPTLSNPYSVAAQQQQYNTQAGEQSQTGSMINQTNPYGTLDYTQDPNAPGGYSANMSYNPTTQALFNQGQTGASAQMSNVPTFANAASSTLPMMGYNYAQALGAGGTSNSLMNTGLGEIASGNYGSGNNVAGTTNALTNQMMGNELNSLSPFFNMQTNNLNTQLLNQGLDPNSTAYKNQMMQNSFNQGQTMSNFLASAQPQAYNEAVSQYELPAQVGEGLLQSGYGAGTLGQGYTGAGGTVANTAGALSGAGSGALASGESMVPGLNSTLTNTPQLNVQPANLVGATSAYNQAEVNEYQTQLQQQTAMMNALFGGVANLGAAGINNGWHY